MIGGKRDQTMREIKCEGCGRRAPNIEIVYYGSADKRYKQLCRSCFNIKVATASGFDAFEHIAFEPVRLTDSAGKPHEFHFRIFMYKQRESAWRPDEVRRLHAGTK
jgi:hypothetical protein